LIIDNNINNSLASMLLLTKKDLMPTNWRWWTNKITAIFKHIKRWNEKYFNWMFYMCACVCM